jgi:acetyl esterase/lipase
MNRVLMLLLLVLVSCVPPAAAQRTEAGTALYLLSNLNGLEGTQRLEGIMYGSHPRQKLDVYIPTGTRAKSKGIMVFGYGGGYKDGNRDEYRFIGQVFANLGLVTVIYDYRLFPEVQFPTYLEDATLAVRWVYDNAKKYGADNNALILAGHSAGAHIAAMLATNSVHLENVNLQPSNLKLVLSLSGGYDFWNAQTGFISPDIAEVMQGAMPQSTQPLEFLTSFVPPMLLMHAKTDSILPINQARTFAARAKSLGADVTLFEYEGDHASTVIDLSKVLRFRSNQFEDLVRQLKTRNLL